MEQELSQVKSTNIEESIDNLEKNEQPENEQAEKEQQLNNQVIEEKIQKDNDDQNSKLENSNETKKNSIDSPSDRPQKQNRKTSLEQSKEIKQEVNNYIKIQKGVNMALVDRKNRSFLQLKKWSETRNNYYKIHRKVSEKLIQNIEKRIAYSFQNMQQFSQYFKDKLNYEQNYLNSQKSLIKLSSLFKDPSFPEFNPLRNNLQNFDDIETKKYQTDLEFFKYIEKDILKDILQKEFSDYDQTITQCRITLRDQNLKFEKLQQLAIDQVFIFIQAQEYTRLYFQMINNQQDPKKKDLYTEQLQYIIITGKQQVILNQIGQTIVNMWLSYLKLEKIRYQKIQEVMTLFIKKSIDLYGNSQVNFTNVQKVLDKTELNLKPELQRLLNETDMKEIDDARLKQTDSLGDFLKNFAFEEIENEPLVVKIVLGFFDTGTVFTQFIPVEIIFTIDNHAIFISNQNNQKEICQVYRLLCLQIDEKNSQNGVLEIVETVPGFFFDSKKKKTIKFDNQDYLEEFLQRFYISKQL